MRGFCNMSARTYSHPLLSKEYDIELLESMTAPLISFIEVFLHYQD